MASCEKSGLIHKFTCFIDHHLRPMAKIRKGELPLLVDDESSSDLKSVF